MGDNMIRDLTTRIGDEAGQTMAEYAVVLAIITVAVIVTLTALGGGISTELNSVVGVL